MIQSFSLFWISTNPALAIPVSQHHIPFTNIKLVQLFDVHACQSGGLGMNYSARELLGSTVKQSVVTFAIFTLLCPGLLSQSPGEERSLELTDSMTIDMVWIPAGEFLMGSPDNEPDRNPDEGPVHRVGIPNGFWMSKYEVTQSQWQAVMGRNPAELYGVGPNHPVYYVSWDDVQAFLERVNEDFRLPTEAEWEYAARAGTGTRFYWSDDIDYSQLSSYAVCGAAAGVSEVGSKRPNRWGLYDMSGNLWEWVEDDYINSYSDAPNDGSALTGEPRGQYRVVRGGSWRYNLKYCRSAFRSRDNPNNRYYTTGFRVVMDP